MDVRFLPALFACLVLICGCTTKSQQVLDDPFGAPPKEASTNCGPEYRYKFDNAINTKEEFVEFVKNNKINKWVNLDSFKGGTRDEVDWLNVVASTKTYIVGDREVYSLEYNLRGCGPTQRHTIKMTNDGYVSVYGCCGE
jgi:hypothetical protein